jgi:hypothetical protein
MKLRTALVAMVILCMIAKAVVLLYQSISTDIFLRQFLWVASFTRKHRVRLLDWPSGDDVRRCIVTTDTTPPYHIVTLDPMDLTVSRMLWFDGHWGNSQIYEKIAAVSVRRNENGPTMPVMVDVGGNLGSISLWFRARGFEVHSFEAQPMLASLMLISAGLNGFAHGFHVHNTILTDRPNRSAWMPGSQR